MRERPILFNGPMVRAILAGQKSQTRRIVKPQPHAGVRHTPFVPSGLEDGHGRELRPPYGYPGDRLWVRETWAYGTHAMAAKRDEDGPFVYRADPMAEQSRLCDRWRPSIHMPKAASRITLEITGVRVQRLQDISEADAQAEGVTVEDHHKGGYCAGEFLPPAVRAFRELWESINGASAWETNPWVWVVEFRRLADG